MVAERVCAVPPWAENPYRLVSLGEIMKSFEASGALSMMFELGRLQAALAQHDETIALDQGVLTELVGIDKRASYDDMGLTLAQATMVKMDALATSGQPTRGDLRRLVTELQGRIVDGAKEIVFLHIEPAKARFYSEVNLFGEEVAGRFPSVGFDVEEAGKCLALDRGTACVFHLMRVMESGLRSLAVTLNDPRIDPVRNPSWDSILKKCREELAKKVQDRAPEWRANEEFFSGVAARLMAVKDAWRNPTMHVGKKYTEEEALDVWNHVKAFMVLMATELRE